MRRLLFTAGLIITAGSIAGAQEQNASSSDRTSIEETIRKVDGERIQAQIHADATALDRIYAADFIGVGPSGTYPVEIALALSAFANLISEMARGPTGLFAF